MSKFIFNPIPVKAGDFVYLNYMDFGNDNFVLCKASINQHCNYEEGEIPNIVVKGIVNLPDKGWDYTPFEIGLNSYQGQKTHLFDFKEHPDSKPHRKVWIARWNPHN